MEKTLGIEAARLLFFYHFTVTLYLLLLLSFYPTVEPTFCPVLEILTYKKCPYPVLKIQLLIRYFLLFYNKVQIRLLKMMLLRFFYILQFRSFWHLFNVLFFISSFFFKCIKNFQTSWRLFYNLFLFSLYWQQSYDYERDYVYNEKSRYEYR